MNNIIAPIAVEVITAGQIGRASDRFSERCRTNAVSLPKDIVQEVLEHEGDQIAQEMFEALRSHVERRASMIVRRVTVDRTITSQQALDATGRKQYTDQGIVDEAAVIGGKVADEDLYIFKPDASAFDEHGLISDDNLERQFELRGLNPADLYQIAGLNKADSAFADEKPNGTHWKDEAGNWCFAAFDRCDGDRYVCVRRRDRVWRDDWSFVGVRKVSPQV